MADPRSIHNLKWMRYFADQREKYSVFVCCEENERPDVNQIELLENEHIFFTKVFPAFSIRTPWKNSKAKKEFTLLTQELQIDCVHVLFATPYGLWLRHYRGYSALTTRGSDVLKVLPQLKESQGIKRFYHRYLLRQFAIAFNNAHVLTSTSNQQIERIHSLFGLTSHCVRTGVDVELIDQIEPNYPSETDKRFRIFSPRFMSPIYDIGLQISALETMTSPELDKVHFLGIRGKQFDTLYFEKIRSRLIELESRGLQWEIIDYLDQNSLMMTMKAADLVIMTPLSDGTPNSALEAMAAKVPLIVSDLPYDNELFTDTCLKCNKRTPEFLISLIRQVQEKKYPENMLQKAFAQVNRYGNRFTEMQKLEQILYSSFQK